MIIVTPTGTRHPDSDAEALIKEARQRQRHRRLATLGAALVLVSLGVAITISAGSKTPGPGPLQHLPSTPGGAVTDPAALKGLGNLAFVSDGDLFVIDGAAGTVANVSGAGHQASTPLYSPNGEWLTYTTDSGLVSWLARGDGTHARRLSGVGSWLGNGQLVVSGPITTETYVLGATGTLHEVTSVKRPSGFGAPAPGATAYLTTTLRMNPPASSRGIEGLWTTSSTTGHPTLWYETSVSFDRQHGLQGDFLGNPTVLLDHAGLLFTEDPGMGDQADGLPIYELRSPGGVPQLLATVLNSSDRPSYGPGSSFALSAGGDRYAWVGKHVELCTASTATCRELHTPARVLSLEASWSPDRSILAFIEASAEPEAATGQREVAAWYATRHLYLLHAGAAMATEVADTTGAAAPIWSANSMSLMFVENDALYLIAHLGATPVELAGPLYPPGGWSGYYGEVDWNDLFAWSAS